MESILESQRGGCVRLSSWVFGSPEVSYLHSSCTISWSSSPCVYKCMRHLLFSSSTMFMHLTDNILSISHCSRFSSKSRIFVPSNTSRVPLWNLYTQISLCLLGLVFMHCVNCFLKQIPEFWPDLSFRAIFLYWLPRNQSLKILHAECT